MERKEIAELLANGEQPWGPLDAATYQALAAEIHANKGRLLVPVVLSGRGRLIDGHHRLMIAQEYGRKTINETEWVVDAKAADPEAEALAAIKYQQHRRQTNTADNARVARGLMRRFAWSQGMVARKLGVSPAAVSQWLKLHPDPDFDVSVRKGQDGKTYELGEEPPAVKQRREKARAGVEVRRRTNNYLEQISDPELARWISDHADGDDLAELIEAWHLIAKAAELVADLLEGQQDKPGPEEPF